MDNMANLVDKLSEKFAGQLALSEDGLAIIAKRENIVELMKALKESYGYNRLTDLTSVDYSDRFEVVYHVINQDVDMLRVKVKLEKEDAKIPSIVSVWQAANGQEREAYDLMGIVFEGHPNLKRILLKDDFEGHPLRKDYKLNVVNRFEK